jgi:biopolymer transport protein TolQ
LKSARAANQQFLRAFRKSPSMDAVAVASEQFRVSPLVTVFDFGYAEVDRQVKARGTLTNKLALERTLQLGISEEVARLERSMSWLATTASVSPFIGLFGTVWGIIGRSARSVQQVAPACEPLRREFRKRLSPRRSDWLPRFRQRAYNYFGSVIREFGTRMEDFTLEFLNMAERSFGDCRWRFRQVDLRVATGAAGFAAARDRYRKSTLSRWWTSCWCC